jgi:hypothetical protein
MTDDNSQPRQPLTSLIPTMQCALQATTLAPSLPVWIAARYQLR